MKPLLASLSTVSEGHLSDEVTPDNVYQSLLIPLETKTDPAASTMHTLVRTETTDDN